MLWLHLLQRVEVTLRQRPLLHAEICASVVHKASSSNGSLWHDMHLEARLTNISE